jgi:hypothetical protein
MENRISIPKPCHENWNEMLPEQQGRHCLACSKMVVDFTDWQSDDILQYLKQKSSEKVCGRFNVSQIEHNAVPESEQLIQKIWQSRMPLLRKIAAVIVICFGLLSGDDAMAQKRMGKVASPKPNTTEQVHMTGEVAMQPDTVKQVPPIQVDTARPQPQIMGMVAPYTPKEKTVILKAVPAKKVKSSR